MSLSRPTSLQGMFRVALIGLPSLRSLDLRGFRQALKDWKLELVRPSGLDGSLSLHRSLRKLWLL